MHKYFEPKQKILTHIKNDPSDPSKNYDPRNVNQHKTFFHLHNTCKNQNNTAPI